MEEELNENDLEERLYAMVYYADETQANELLNPKHDVILQTIENAPRSTIRRYWRTSTDGKASDLKVNTSIDSGPINNSNVTTTDLKPKNNDENHNITTIKPVNLSVFQSPIPKDVKKTIEILENDSGNVVELDSSDEDEVVEVALPPKPTITIESSDDEELKNISEEHSQNKEIINNEKFIKKPGNDREVSASPVPSIVSSVSDEFIRGDCIALNISSKRPDNHSFDFSLHGSDLLDHRTPSKKKKKKKSKERITSTPVDSESTQIVTLNNGDECFATPKSKAKNKRQKNKSQSLSEKIVATIDFYDSDSNHSIESKKSRNSYTVTEKSVPSSDVYESDSSQSETQKEISSNNSTPSKPKEDHSNIIQQKHVSNDNPQKSTPKTGPKSKDSSTIPPTNTMTSRRSNDFIAIDDTDIDENIVMANVTGFSVSEDYENESMDNDIQRSAPKLGSTKVPAILNEDLDFDNLKGISKVCRRRKYSMTALRAEMEKFYNESWGGENFNHREIQKYMSRDKSLWVIDPKDRMPAQYRKKSISCNYCNRQGHRDDMCQLKPPICYMCGSTGHYEPRCPQKICVNCGSPNYMYSTMCRNCATWGRMKCAECGQVGHPSSHCPDIWRRYHNTIDMTMPLAENRQTKSYHQLFCSGCTRRGHLIHTCRISLPFSGLPINSPYVFKYTPVYLQVPEEYRSLLSINQAQCGYKQPKLPNQESPNITERNKRQSKSPTVHESHVNKKRNVSEASEDLLSSKLNKYQQITEITEDSGPKLIETTVVDTDKALDFIPIVSSNHDKRGQMIQDNEVSDSSHVVTAARIYITKDIVDKLKTEEGEQWLSGMCSVHSVIVQHNDSNLFLIVKGRVIDQEYFQNDLRKWTKENSKTPKSDNEGDGTIQESGKDETSTLSNNIPKNRNNLLRKLNKALESLKQDIGDPSLLYKELTYLQNHQVKLLNQSAISPKKISNNRDHMNQMLKKLNMVLLGQAGLADGSKHVSELYALKEKLTNFRQKNISSDLRAEIGKHYHCIFTAMPRNDYAYLLSKYYVSKRNIVKKKKNYIRPTKQIQLKKFKGIPPQPKNMNNSNETDGPVLNENNAPLCNDNNVPGRVQKTMGQLIVYHKRLMRARPVDAVLKKTRLELVRRLHSHIAALGRNTYMSSKSLKKMKKIQEQAQLFLTNV